MCKHCERLERDADFKATMHAFMARAASNLSAMQGIHIPPEDIDIKFEIVGASARILKDRPTGGIFGDNDEARVRAWRMIEQAFTPDPANG